MITMKTLVRMNNKYIISALVLYCTFGISSLLTK